MVIRNSLTKATVVQRLQCCWEHIRINYPWVRRLRLFFSSLKVGVMLTLNFVKIAQFHITANIGLISCSHKLIFYYMFYPALKLTSGQ